jgi:hypothetical protein
VIFVVLVPERADGAASAAPGAEERAAFPETTLGSDDVIPEEPTSGDWEGVAVTSGDNAIDELMKSLVRSHPNFFNASSYGLEGNYAVLQEERGQLEPDGSTDKVRLIALRKDDGIYDRALLLEVVPASDSPFLITLSEDVRGFESRIELKNFTSSNKSEILLSVKNGSGGTGRLILVEARGREGRVLYDSRTFKKPTIKGRFFDNYRAEIFVQETGARTLISLLARKANYDRNLVYNEASGNLRTLVTLWWDQYSELQPMDVDGDGIYELKGICVLNGIGRSDPIAYVESTLKYAEEQWRVLDTWIAPAEDLSNLPLPIRIN